jgi:hypothetical protein
MWATDCSFTNKLRTRPGSPRGKWFLFLFRSSITPTLVSLIKLVRGTQFVHPDSGFPRFVSSWDHRSIRIRIRPFILPSFLACFVSGWTTHSLRGFFSAAFGVKNPENYSTLTTIRMIRPCITLSIYENEFRWYDLRGGSANSVSLCGQPSNYSVCYWFSSPC